MLAHMIGDGSCIKRQPVRYASIDEANIAAVTIAAAHFGITPIRDEYAAARVTISHQGGRARSPGIKCQEVVAQIAGRVRRPGTDTIPVEIWDYVREFLQNVIRRTTTSL